MKPLSIVILAAGLGSRMRSELPKPLHPIGGKPMLAHVLDSARKLNPAELIVVYGHKGELLREAFQHEEDIIWAEQKTFEGTGDAMGYALPFCNKTHNLLVLYGDTPLIAHETLQKLVTKVSDEHPIAWLTATVENPFGYGRIIRNDSDEMIAIVEEKDATEEERKIAEINTGIFATSVALMAEKLALIGNNNQQNEYYLTDIAKIAAEEKRSIATLQEEPHLILGVNDRVQLSILERIYQEGEAKRLMQNGITLERPESVMIKGSIQNGVDCHIAANVTLEGNIILGKNVTIKTGAHLKDVVIGDHTVIHPYSVIEGAVIGESSSIGPFARIREKSRIGNNTRIGNFVETKKITFGDGSKAGHLTYLGDANIGNNVNIGAGTITCNYDGVNKSTTTIEDNGFIGSNNSLIAPVTIGEGATTAAGAIISKDVKEEALAFNQISLKQRENWKRPTKK